MMNKITYTAISIFMFSFAWGMDIKLTNGTILREVTVAEINSRGIELMHRDGCKKILPEMIAESDRSKLKDQITQYKQLSRNQKITNAIQKARCSGSINAAIPILEQAINSEPEATNIAEAQKFLTALKEKSKFNITAALRTADDEKELSQAIEVLEKAIAENSLAENLSEAQEKLKELSKKRLIAENQNIAEAIRRAKSENGLFEKIELLEKAIENNKNASNLQEAKEYLTPLQNEFKQKAVPSLDLEEFISGALLPFIWGESKETCFNRCESVEKFDEVSGTETYSSSYGYLSFSNDKLIGITQFIGDDGTNIENFVKNACQRFGFPEEIAPLDTVWKKWHSPNAFFYMARNRYSSQSNLYFICVTSPFDVSKVPERGCHFLMLEKQRREHILSQLQQEDSKVIQRNIAEAEQKMAGLKLASDSVLCTAEITTQNGGSINLFSTDSVIIVAKNSSVEIDLWKIKSIITQMQQKCREHLSGNASYELKRFSYNNTVLNTRQKVIDKYLELMETQQKNSTAFAMRTKEFSFVTGWSNYFRWLTAGREFTVSNIQKEGDYYLMGFREINSDQSVFYAVPFHKKESEATAVTVQNSDLYILGTID